MTRDWADLPEDTLYLISSNLFLPKEQQSFRLVCRSWYTAASRSQFHLYPYLMLYQRSKRMWKLIQYHNVFYMDFPQLHNASIRCSKYGWLLACVYDEERLFFFNPFTREKIELPYDHDTPSYTTLSFFNPPTSSDCFVVGISSKVHTPYHDIFSSGHFWFISIGMLRKGDDKEWTKCVYTRDTDTTTFVVSSCIPIMHRQLLYFLDVSGNISTFDISNHDINDSLNVYDECLWPPRIRDKVRQSYLVKIKEEEGGVLYAVFVVHEERQVRVYRLLEPDMEWELVEDIGDRVMVVGQTASFGGVAPFKCMENKIYFPKLEGHNNGVFYCLDTKRYQSFDGKFSSKKGYGLRELDLATWVMPQK